MLSADVREAFDEAADQNEGEALAEVQVVSLHHREFSCGGCNAELPRDAYSRVAAQRDDLVTCLTCGRILYMDQLPDLKRTAKQKAKDPDAIEG
jgi:predicted  nucleic acid-binding Zn-ribbon protein